MATITIYYWRDIPAQVSAGGRRGRRQELPARFSEAIDRAAMASGAAGTDAYLAGWRRGEPREVPGEDAAAIAAETARLDAAYDMERLRALIAAAGWNP